MTCYKLLLKDWLTARASGLMTLSVQMLSQDGEVLWKEQTLVMVGFKFR